MFIFYFCVFKVNNTEGKRWQKEDIMSAKCWSAAGSEQVGWVQPSLCMKHTAHFSGHTRQQWQVQIFTRNTNIYPKFSLLLKTKQWHAHCFQVCLLSGSPELGFRGFGDLVDPLSSLALLVSCQSWVVFVVWQGHPRECKEPRFSTVLFQNKWSMLYTSTVTGFNVLAEQSS